MLVFFFVKTKKTNKKQQKNIFYTEFFIDSNYTQICAHLRAPYLEKSMSILFYWEIYTVLYNRRSWY